MSNPILDVLISNIKEDQMLLTVVQAKIEESKNQKQEIVNRLKKRVISLREGQITTDVEQGKYVL